MHLNTGAFDQDHFVTQLFRERLLNLSTIILYVSLISSELRFLSICVTAYSLVQRIKLRVTERAHLGYHARADKNHT